MSEIIRINNHDYTVSEIKAEMENLREQLLIKDEIIAELNKAIDIYKSTANKLLNICKEANE